MRNIEIGQQKAASKNLSLSPEHVTSLQNEISQSPVFAFVFASIGRAIEYNEDMSGNPSRISGELNLAYKAVDSLLVEDGSIISKMAFSLVLSRSVDNNSNASDDDNFLSDCVEHDKNDEDDDEDLELDLDDDFD